MRELFHEDGIITLAVALAKLLRETRGVCLA